MAERPPPAPILFLFAGLPYGVAGAFATQVMPYLASDANISIDDIGWYEALLLIPPMVQFLYAPVIDIGPKRKHWLVFVSVLSGVCLALATIMPLPDHATAFMVLALIAQLVSGLVGSCAGGMLASLVPDHLRGRAGGWYNIGNVSGGGLSATIAIAMTEANAEPLVIGLVLGALSILPAFVVLAIDEPLRDKNQPPAAVFRSMLSEVKGVLTSRSGITGILLSMSPVGTAALTNYFTGMAKSYGAKSWLPYIAPLNVVATAVGGYVGGILCDRYNRRVLYLISGALTALCGFAMAVSPDSPATFAWGAITYSLVTGFCYSAFYATVLETIGEGGAAAATKFTLFLAAGNAAISYVGLVDSRFDANYGVTGVTSSDATLNLAGVIVLGIVFWALGTFGKWRHDKPATPV